MQKHFRFSVFLWRDETWIFLQLIQARKQKIAHFALLKMSWWQLTVNTEPNRSNKNRLKRLNRLTLVFKENLHKIPSNVWTWCANIWNTQWIYSAQWCSFTVSKDEAAWLPSINNFILNQHMIWLISALLLIVHPCLLYFQTNCCIQEQNTVSSVEYKQKTQQESSLSFKSSAGSKICFICQQLNGKICIWSLNQCMIWCFQVSEQVCSSGWNSLMSAVCQQSSRESQLFNWRPSTWSLMCTDDKSTGTIQQFVLVKIVDALQVDPSTWVNSGRWDSSYTTWTTSPEWRHLTASTHQQPWNSLTNMKHFVQTLQTQTDRTRSSQSFRAAAGGFITFEQSQAVC